MARVGVRRLFVDAHQLVRDSAEVATEVCDVAGLRDIEPAPRLVDLLIAGFPCTDISTLNCGAKLARSCVSAGTLRTGGVLKSIISTMRLSNVYMVMLENTRSLDHRTPAQKCRNELSNCAQTQCALSVEVDMATLAIELTPLMLGSPESRTRMYT